MEHYLCPRNYSRCWKYINEQSENVPVLMVLNIFVVEWVENRQYRDMSRCNIILVSDKYFEEK